MAGASPRVIVVVRDTEYEQLLARHATRSQAAFFLSTRDQSIDDVQARHDRFHAALHHVTNAVPKRWRRTVLTRADLAQFLFAPDDIVAVVGQDGLVANVAKYLDQQPVIGINPDPERYDGVLVRHRPDDFARLLTATYEGPASPESRTMVEARLDDGQRLVALNEVFVGVRTHQSARYRICCRDDEERHSSSGLIVTTGTGATGWARSIQRERASSIELPKPTERSLAFFVREAFPSIATGVELTVGRLDAGCTLEVTSENERDGIIFGDGIEADFLVFDWGQRVRIGVATEQLHLVA